MTTVVIKTSNPGNSEFNKPIELLVEEHEEFEDIIKLTGVFEGGIKTEAFPKREFVLKCLSLKVGEYAPWFGGGLQAVLRPSDDELRFNFAPNMGQEVINVNRSQFQKAFEKV